MSLDYRKEPLDAVIAAAREESKCNLWQFLEHEHTREIERLEYAILNPETTDQQTHDLKQRRAALLAVSPGAIVRKLGQHGAKARNDYQK